MTTVTEEFNARGSRTADVAKTFVPPLAQFETLLTSDHHRLVGPRGSGKTTLLKMLTLEALRNWKHPEADRYIRAIKYNAVFVQTDRAWANQLAITSKQIALDVGDAAFCLHTLVCLVEAMKSAIRPSSNPALSHLVAEFKKDDEVLLAELVAKTLGLELIVPSFLGVQTALRGQLVSLLNPLLAPSVCEKYSSNNLMPLISMMIETFNDLAGTPERQWAFLFDELEIAPPKVVDYLVSNMRGADNRVILKLALAPYHHNVESISRPTSPMSGHDFATVRLTYANKQEALEFTTELTKRIFNDRGITFGSLDELFASREPRVDRRTKSTDRYILPEVFLRLAERDPTFAAYAERKQLFARDYTGAENDRASDIRKILPIVQLRDFFLREFREASQGKSDAIKRARKSVAPYTGFPSILEITEGNPRVILTLMVPLARELAITRDANRNERLQLPEQNRAIERAVHVLESLVRAIPLTSNSSKRGLLELLDAIGSFFSEKLYGPFDAEFTGTFTVDRNVSSGLMEIVGSALNAGALIFVPPEDGSGHDIGSDLRGCRFRLSYLLAPLYGLPLTLGRSASLTTILRGSNTFRQAEFDLFERRP